MTAEQAERVRPFLLALGRLTLQYGVSVGACGCCLSPFLRDLRADGQKVGEDVRWQDGTDRIGMATD